MVFAVQPVASVRRALMALWIRLTMTGGDATLFTLTLFSFIIASENTTTMKETAKKGVHRTLTDRLVV